MRVRLKGESVSKNFSTYEDAKEFELKTIRQIETGTYVQGVEKAKDIFSALLKKYRDEVSTKKKGHAQETSILNRAIDYKKLSEKRICDITYKDIEAYQKHLLNCGLKPLSVNRHRDALRHVFNHAANKWRLAVGNPVAEASAVPVIKEDVRQAVRLNADTIKLIEQNTKSKSLVNAMWLAIWTTCRAGELVKLEVRDYANGCLTIRESKTDKKGDYLPSRVIPLTEKAELLIKELIAKIPNPKPNSKILGLKRRDALTTAMTRVKKKLLEKHGVVLDVRFHDTRHTGLSELFAYGLEGKDGTRIKLNSMEIGKYFSGHKTDAMLRKYIHAEAEDLKIRMK